MSLRIKKYLIKYKYEVIGLLLLPTILFFLHKLLLFFNQLGIYFGTFLRNLYEFIV